MRVGERSFPGVTAVTEHFSAISGKSALMALVSMRVVVVGAVCLTCQVPEDQAAQVIADVTAVLNAGI